MECQNLEDGFHWMHILRDIHTHTTRHQKHDISNVRICTFLWLKYSTNNIRVYGLCEGLWGQYNPKYACWSTIVEIWTKMASYCESCEGWSEGDHSKAKNDHFLSHLLGLRGTSQPKMLHKIHFIYAMHAHDGSFQNFVQL